MSWNEPDHRDDRNKKRDPWGRQQDEMPPNIDEVLKQFHQKLRGLFGMRSGNQFSGEGKGPTLAKGANWNFGYIAGIIFILYVLSGFYVVKPAEEAVVLRFGHYQRTESSGFHWIPRLVESKKIVNVQEVKTVEISGQMLTKDENIVSAQIAVQYRIHNPQNYLFNIVDPELTLRQVSESALRSVVGESTLNEVLTSGRSEIGIKIRNQAQHNLNNYGTGIEISDLAMQQTKAPEEVRAAFDDAIRAQQDEERSVNEAEAYARKIIPIAEGQAKRTLEEARAYREKVMMQAQGKTAQFLQLLPEYRRAPQVTRDRMYMDTLQEVYVKTPKILVDVSGGNNVIYLPVDQLQRKKVSPTPSRIAENQSTSFLENQSSTMPSLASSVPDRPDYEDPDRSIRGGE